MDVIVVIMQCTKGRKVGRQALVIAVLSSTMLQIATLE